MIILAIDTSCDETAAAVTQGNIVLSNVIWSQASLHAKFGGVMPSLAQRMHQERIDWVIKRALQQAKCKGKNVDRIAVTAGPGLAIALGVGITKAMELKSVWDKPSVAINHIEGHLLSPLAVRNTRSDFNLADVFPALGLVVSGGHTELVEIGRPGSYAILAKTQDDALGEALDKAARLLGLGYPGGAILEKMAKLGNPKEYPLPLPMARQERIDAFSYSGLKSAFMRLVSDVGNVAVGERPELTLQQIYDLAACFQNRAFQHLERVVAGQIKLANQEGKFKSLLVGGGVIANTDLKKRLRKIAKVNGLKLMLPYSKKLVGDNAAMIGVAAAISKHTPENTLIDRKPRWSVEDI